jgi:hypothetical protein
MADNSTPPEQPRVEPEIIPPDRNHGSSHSPWRTTWGPYGSRQAYGTQRVYVTRLGPFGFAVLMLVLAAVVALFFVAIIGVFLLWIPVVALLLAAAALYRFLRR